MLTLMACGLAAHVRILYSPGQVGPIRNANLPQGDGAASVDGACGGANAYGANGVGIVQDGASVTLTINYAAGHQSAANQFKMAFACGDGSPASVEVASAALTAAANGCTGKVSGVASAYPVPAPDAIVPGGYEITCNLPTMSVLAATACTISVLDQRNWGGCVDVDVLPADLAQPPAPPPSPYVSNQGDYAFTEAGKIDTGAAGVYTCCALAAGSLSVPAYAMGAPTLAANIRNGVASNCRTNALPTAPSTATLLVNQPLQMSLAPGFANKYVGTIPATSPSMGNQPFEFVIEQGRLSFTNVGAEAPIICDGQAAIAGAPGSAIGDGSANPPPELAYLQIDLLIVAPSAAAITESQTRAMRSAVASRLLLPLDRVTVTLAPVTPSVRASIEASYQEAPEQAAAARDVMAAELGTVASANAFFRTVQVVQVPTLSLSAIGIGGGASDGFGGWGVTAVVLMLMLAGFGAYKCRQKLMRPPPPPKPAAYNYPEGAAGVAMPAAGYPVTRPPPPATPPPPPTGVPPLPAGYLAVVDPSSGATYYYNHVTGESTWARPT